jgi:hypothetical protein
MRGDEDGWGGWRCDSSSGVWWCGEEVMLVCFSKMIKTPTKVSPDLNRHVI